MTEDRVHELSSEEMMLVSGGSLAHDIGELIGSFARWSSDGLAKAKIVY